MLLETPIKCKFEQPDLLLKDREKKLQSLSLPKQLLTSSRRMSRAGGGGGGGWRSLCIKISYSEPTRAESREGTSTLAESSRVTYNSILIG